MTSHFIELSKACLEGITIAFADWPLSQLHKRELISDDDGARIMRRDDADSGRKLRTTEERHLGVRYLPLSWVLVVIRLVPLGTSSNGGLIYFHDSAHSACRALMVCGYLRNRLLIPAHLTWGLCVRYRQLTDRTGFFLKRRG